MQIPRLHLRSLSCGWRHTGGIDLQGRLVTWGWGGTEDHFGVGTGVHSEEEGHGWAPGGRVVPRSQSPLRVALVCRPSGGQLGHSELEGRFLPSPVGYVHPLGGQNPLQQDGKPFDEQLAQWKAVAVSCGYNHTACVVGVPSSRIRGGKL